MVQQDAVSSRDARALAKYKLPNEKRPSTRGDVLLEMLEAVASQETAISHFLHAEAMKIQAFTGPDGEFPTAPSNQQINEFQTSVTRMIESLADIQRLMLRTVECAQSLLNDRERADDDE
ncbi:hypothetical protein [Cohnella nanjingensis]|uniref:Uncharacterized protein n=1 Tax=Cohnella nanjingensis TaxID=1387779 RepID=A0A7X0RZY7_9BACL|nr:hypothetical protein [Cohnella nanjingensis]MBB6675154.1 hypothetical protein [Cohnella nanjingensis]